jgi:hypothetical protein
MMRVGLYEINGAGIALGDLDLGYTRIRLKIHTHRYAEMFVPEFSRACYINNRISFVQYL